jgi:hypothetical protein
MYQCNGTPQQDWHRDSDDRNDFITNDTGGCLEMLIGSEKYTLKLGVCNVKNKQQQFYIQQEEKIKCNFKNLIIFGNY